MTNGWTDIRNADVILAMGGNPAENHPVGFRFVMEARRNRNAKLVSRRSPIQSHGGGRGSLRPDPRRHRHRVPRRADQLRPDPQPVSRRIRPPVHQRAVPGLGTVRLRREARRVRRMGRREEGVRGQVELELRARRAGVREGRSHARASAIGVPGDEALLRALHARHRLDHLRLQRRRLREGGGAHHLDAYARSRRHDPVCARLDAPQPLGAADSCRGDAAAAARQHRAARRRAQRAARSRQYPGRHRLRHGVSQPARLHRHPEGRSRVAGLVHRRGDAEAAAAERPRTSGPTPIASSSAS